MFFFSRCRFLRREKKNIYTLLTGGILARYRDWEKFPNFRGPCDRLSHRGKNGKFFPTSEGRNSSPRKKGDHYDNDLWIQIQSKEKTSSIDTRLSNSLAMITIVSDGVLSCEESAPGPGPGGPQGGSRGGQKWPKMAIFGGSGGPRGVQTLGV